MFLASSKVHSISSAIKRNESLIVELETPNNGYFEATTADVFRLVELADLPTP